jgi:phage terminase large subunit
MLPTADPIALAKLLWPDVHFYDKQREVIYSVAENDETFVTAGNMLGKDFVAAFIILWFFISREPCRVVTTSVDGMQLEGVLWGEIRRFIQTSKYELSHDKGGPIVVNHLHLRKILQIGSHKGRMCGVSYCIGRVAAKGEGMLGHHVAEIGDNIPRTLFVADEASGVEDLSYDRADTWAKRKLVIGNPFPCSNFFYKGVKGGDLKAKGKLVKTGDDFMVPGVNPY